MASIELANISKIGQALRIGLEHGMHTDMQSQHVSQHVVQRCRKTWWTVYMLDRQTSALMGVPSTIRDEDISAELPLYPHSTQKSMALEIQVKLSRVIAQISDSKPVMSPLAPVHSNFLSICE